MLFRISLAFILACGSSAAWAQTHDGRVELAGAFGFAQAKGEPPPDLSMIGGGVGVWFGDRIGVGWSASFGPGQRDGRYPTPQGSPVPPFPRFVGDRRARSSGSLHFERVTFRYAQGLGSRLAVVLGAGALLHARYHRTDMLAVTLSEIALLESDEEWSGLSYEVLLRVRLARRLTLQPGLVFDVAADRVYTQPVLRVVASFW
jgi:hypothetical protein